MGIFAVDLAPRPSALTSDGEKFDYVYNPWGQLVRIVGLGGDPVTKAVAVYTYSAMGHRISEQLDTNDGGNSGMPDTVVDSNDPVFYIATDPSGRRLATYRDLDSDPKESFIHHDARIRGPVHQGGPILRDRNANLATAPEEWASVGAEAERYERHYYLLDYRGYVSAIVTGDGTLVEQVRYSATGVPFNIPLGDVNADGKVESGGGGDPDFDDISSMVGLPAKYHVRGDLDLDGDVDAADLGIAQARDGTVTGRGYLTIVGADNRILMPELEFGGHEIGLGSSVADQSVLHLMSVVMLTGHADAEASLIVAMPVPGSKWPISPTVAPNCWLQYKAAELSCKVANPPGLARNNCLETANAVYQGCVAITHYPIDRITFQLKCTGLAGAPVGPICNLYGPCEGHMGVNFRCMCNCMGNSRWSMIARACIRCSISAGVHPFTAHALCWKEATERAGMPPIFLLYSCEGRCRWEQSLCGSIEEY